MAQPKGTAKTPTATDAKPLLELSTLDHVEFVKIDGKRYDLVNLDALPIRPRQRIATLFARVLELIIESSRDGEPPLSKRKEKELSAGIKQLLPMLIPTISPATINKLNEVQRQEIAMTFFVIRSERMGRSTALDRMASMASPTGASSSPDSNGSTAAPPNRGTRRSRRRS